MCLEWLPEMPLLGPCVDALSWWESDSFTLRERLFDKNNTQENGLEASNCKIVKTNDREQKLNEVTLNDVTDTKKEKISFKKTNAGI